jgi:predicted AAA+ superfamily ATPase
MKTIERFFKPPGHSFFLFGPRGTGKSTWLKQQYKNALFINLLETDILREYRARPERLIAIIDGNQKQHVIIIDEIQKAPDLLPVVHTLIEQKHGLTFILTGSSVRKLKKTGVDLLAGRALKKNMHPFMAAELGDLFDIQKALTIGLVPIVAAALNPEEVLKTYIDIYLREEVQMEGLVRDLGAFSRFLEAATLSQGQMVNVTNVAADCQVERKSVEGYFKIVEDLLIGFTLPVFTKRAKRAVVAHPKFYFFDCGVYRSIRPKGPLDSPQEITGAALEGLVAQHLKAWIEYGGHDVSIHFWRTRAGSEVDFILYGDSIFLAIEVKASFRIKAENLRGLKAFMQDYPQSKAVLLYMGKDRLRMEGISCIPCPKFLAGLVPGQLPSID